MNNFRQIRMHFVGGGERACVTYSVSLEEGDFVLLGLHIGQIAACLHSALCVKKCEVMTITNVVQRSKTQINSY